MRYKNMTSSSRHPFQILILILCLSSGIPIILGASPGPESVEAQLPPLASHIWAWILVIGALITLIGIAMKNRANGLILEQLGLAFVGIMAFFYSALIVIQIGSPGWISASIIFAFAGACLTRWKQIQDYLHQVKKQAEDETSRGSE